MKRRRPQPPHGWVPAGEGEGVGGEVGWGRGAAHDASKADEQLRTPPFPPTPTPPHSLLEYQKVSVATGLLVVGAGKKRLNDGLQQRRGDGDGWKRCSRCQRH